MIGCCDQIGSLKLQRSAQENTNNIKCHDVEPLRLLLHLATADAHLLKTRSIGFGRHLNYRYQRVL